MDSLQPGPLAQIPFRQYGRQSWPPFPSLKTQVDTDGLLHGEPPSTRSTTTSPTFTPTTATRNWITSSKPTQGFRESSSSPRLARWKGPSPPRPPIITDPAYGSSEEFQKTAEKLKDNGGKPSPFYTLKLGYPAFVFAVLTNSQSIAEAIISLAEFLPPYGREGRRHFPPGSGVGVTFSTTRTRPRSGRPLIPTRNPGLPTSKTTWSIRRSGSKFNPDRISGRLGPGFRQVRHCPYLSLLHPPAARAGVFLQVHLPFAGKPAASFSRPRPACTILIAFCATLGWVLIVGSHFLRAHHGPPLRKASAAILNAANGKGHPDA